MLWEKNIERIGDKEKNIEEKVYYIVNGMKMKEERKKEEMRKGIVVEEESKKWNEKEGYWKRRMRMSVRNGGKR